MEASSHGLDQFRLDGVRLAAGALTNLTRDHLDYHGTMAAYRAAKLRLFAELLPSGAPAVANADMDLDTLDDLRDIARRRHLVLGTVGATGTAIRLHAARNRPAAARPVPGGQRADGGGARHGARHPRRTRPPGHADWRARADGAGGAAAQRGGRLC